VKILVLGLGNDLYGDDGVGLHAVRMLESQWTAGRSSSGDGCAVDFEACPLSGLALLEILEGYNALVIIDTIQKSDPLTGRVSVLDGTEVRDVPGPSPHYISVPQTLALGRSLGLQMPETVKIVAVEAKNLFRLGEGLSEAMRAALPDIAAAARGIIETWTSVAPNRPHRLRPID
jgi:hydrogenase maturation protease